MIRREWRDPNFKFEVSDADGQTYTFIGYGDSEQELRARLAKRQFTVLHIAPYDFAEWRNRARVATEKAIAAHKAGRRPIKFDSSLWTELKWHLFELFHGKCSYCEWRPRPGSSADVEHFRPKHKVTEDPKHPGYYWLAYDVSNLLPSCEHCNRARGKMNHFPVEGNVYAYDAGELAKERPLLLNPMDQTEEGDPLTHLSFDEFGVVTGRTASGEVSRKFYHLNRGNLAEARREAQAKVEQDWDVLTIRVQFVPAYAELRDQLRMGVREYSAALVAQLERLKAQRLKDLADL